MNVSRLILVQLFLAVSALAGAQCVEGSVGPDACSRDAMHSSPGRAASLNAYSFPDAKQRFRNYLDAAFGPLAVVRSAIGAGIDQSKPAPPEWDSGAQGYAERYGFRFGMFLIGETTRYSLGAAMREDVAYHKCLCTGFLPRSGHAFISAFTARTRSGATVFSVPSLIAPYAGAFTAVNAWYPARYEAMDAARLGSMAFTFQIGGNMLREFLPRHN